MDHDLQPRERARNRREEPPRPAPAHPLLRVQASAGNAATARLVARLTPPRNAQQAQERSASALTQHLDQSRMLLDWLAEGRRSTDVLLKNACDWVAMGNSKLYAVTPTGDSDERVAHHGQDPTQRRAYFPKVDNAAEGGDITNPGGGNYNWRDLDDQTHVKLEPVATKGWNTATALPSAIAVAGVPTAVGIAGWFTNATADAIGKEEFFTTIKHEVQHAADRSEDKEAPIRQQAAGEAAAAGALERVVAAIKAAQANLDPNDLALMPGHIQAALTRMHAAKIAQLPMADPDIQAVRTWSLAKQRDLAELQSLARLQRYKTEFRAYSYQGTYLAYDNRANYDAEVPARFRIAGRPWTERQYRVFRQIYLGYDHTNQGWETNDIVFGTAQRFREAVLAYRDPDTEGVNKLDSPRINVFYERLMAVPLNTANANLQQVRDLDAPVRALTPEEATYVRNATGATRELTALMNARLQGMAAERIEAILDERANAR